MTDLGEVITAMVTPFNQELEVDLGLAHKLMEHLVSNGSDGILISGTTGESPTLDDEEKLNLFKYAQENFGAQAKIIAGTGSNDTRHTVELSKRAEQLGVDALLIVTPYYNKPSPEGLYRHFEAVASGVSLPIIVYNVPSRTGSNIDAETCIRLSGIDNIIGVKEASGNLSQISEIAKAKSREFLIYSGNDCDTLPVLSIGGQGVISVASHLVGNQIKKMVGAFKRGDVMQAQNINNDLMDFFKVIFISSNPVPIKEALNLTGLKVGKTRLPLWSLEEKKKDRLIDTLKKYSLV